MNKIASKNTIEVLQEEYKLRRHDKKYVDYTYFTGARATAKELKNNWFEKFGETTSLATKWEFGKYITYYSTKSKNEFIVTVDDMEHSMLLSGEIYIIMIENEKDDCDEEEVSIDMETEMCVLKASYITEICREDIDMFDELEDRIDSFLNKLENPEMTYTDGIDMIIELLLELNKHKMVGDYILDGRILIKQCILNMNLHGVESYLLSIKYKYVLLEKAKIQRQFK